MNQKINQENGLSLIEMIVIIAVLSIICVSVVSGLGSLKKTLNVEKSRSRLIDIINDSRTNSIKTSQYICTIIQSDSSETNTIIKTYIAANIEQSIGCPCITPSQCTLKNETILKKSQVFNDSTSNTINLIHEAKTGSLVSNKNLQLSISYPDDENILKRQVEVKTGGLATVAK